MRSLFFVSADDERKIDRGLGAVADALIFDLPTVGAVNA